MDEEEDYNDGNDDDDSVQLLRSVQHYACLLKRHVLFLNQYFLYDNTTYRNDDTTVAIDHFRVSPSLSFKASLNAKFLLL